MRGVSKEPHMRGRNSGFTLIEMVIVIVILGIMATIALPSYQNSVRKGQRSDGKATLLAVAGRMEQYMLDHGAYTYNMEDLGYDDDPMISPEQHFTIDASACSGGDETSCYILTATPRASSPLKSDKECTTFVLAYTGARSATGTKAAECW